MWALENVKTEVDNFFWSRNDSNYLDIKLKVFKGDDNRYFRLVQILTMGETDFNQFMRLRSQLVVAAENFGRKGKVVPSDDINIVQRPGWTNQTGHKVVDVVVWAIRKLYKTLPRYEQAGKLICSSPNICKEEDGQRTSTNGLSEMETWKINLFTWCIGFCKW